MRKRHLLTACALLAGAAPPYSAAAFFPAPEARSGPASFARAPQRRSIGAALSAWRERAAAPAPAAPRAAHHTRSTAGAPHAAPLRRGSRGSAARAALVQTLLSMRPETTKELRHITDWDTVQRKTEYVEKQRRRLEGARMPLLRKLLRSLSPDALNHPDANGQTPLHFAAWAGGADLVELFLAAGADVSARDAIGHTPLHKAVVRGHAGGLAVMLRRSPPELRGELMRFSDGAGSALPPAQFAALFGRAQRGPLTDPAPPPDTGAPCAPDGGWGTPRRPGDPPCDIDRRAALAPAEWYREYFLRGRAVVLRGALPLRERCAFQRSNFARVGELGRRRRCGSTAYPSLTRQRLCEEAFTVRDLQAGATCRDGAHPTCTAPALTASWNSHNQTLPYSLLSARLLAQSVPPFAALEGKWWQGTSRFQFFIGGAGSGAAFHFHRDAYNAVFFGEKEWLLSPPYGAGLSGVPTEQWAASARPPGLEGGPLRCVQSAGDAVVLPSHWGHATLNRALTLATGNLFCANAERPGGPSPRADPTCGSAGRAAVASAKGESALLLYPPAPAASPRPRPSPAAGGATE